MACYKARDGGDKVGAADLAAILASIAAVDPRDSRLHLARHRRSTICLPTLLSDGRYTPP